jgi:hypothetical protein
MAAKKKNDTTVAETTELRAAVMLTMVQNCVSTMLVTGIMGEVVPHELDIVKISMVSVFSAAFHEDPDKVLGELEERVAQATGTAQV